MTYRFLSPAYQELAAAAEYYDGELAFGLGISGLGTRDLHHIVLDRMALQG